MINGYAKSPGTQAVNCVLQAGEEYDRGIPESGHPTELADAEQRLIPFEEQRYG